MDAVMDTVTDTAVNEAELTGKPRTGGQSEGESALVEQDLLVEDVSIDGMCGVY